MTFFFISVVGSVSLFLKKCFLGNVKDEVFFRQRHLTQVNDIWQFRKSAYIFPGNAHFIFHFGCSEVLTFSEKNFMLLCGDIEKILEPPMLQ